MVAGTLKTRQGATQAQELRRQRSAHVRGTGLPSPSKGRTTALLPPLPAHPPFSSLL